MIESKSKIFWHPPERSNPRSRKQLVKISKRSNKNQKTDIPAPVLASTAEVVMSDYVTARREIERRLRAIKLTETATEIVGYLFEHGDVLMSEKSLTLKVRLDSSSRYSETRPLSSVAVQLALEIETAAREAAAKDD